MNFEDADFPLKKTKKWPKKKKRTNTAVFFNIFQKIISNFQQNPNTKMVIMNIAKENDVQSRPIYDFFNLLIYFGVCVKRGGGRIGWVGFSKMYEHFEEAYIDVEIQSITKPLQKIFITEDSPTLGFLASKIISLFLYLGAECLTLKDVARLLNGCDYKMQSFERRVSLVLHMLVVFGVVTQTNHLREYRLEIDSKQFDAEAFKSRLEALARGGAVQSMDQYPCCLLNKYEEHTIARLREIRKIEYNSLVDSFQTQPASLASVVAAQNDHYAIQQSRYVTPVVLNTYASDPGYDLPNHLRIAQSV